MPRDSEARSPDLADALCRLREFRLGKTEERLFVHPIGHPSEPSGFCFCEGSAWRTMRFYAKAVLLDVVFKSPFNGLKVWLLRRFGARIGGKVFFSVGVWIDPTFPELLTIEDSVFFGMGVKLFTHEYRINEFRAGKVRIRRGAFVGAFAVVPCGVEIGEGAMVAACSVVHRDVPPGATLISPPGKILKRTDIGEAEDGCNRE